MQPVASRANARFFGGLLVAVGLLNGCGEVPTQHSPTRAIIQNVVGWTTSNLNGYFDSPLYPVSIPNTFYTLAYSGIVTGNSFATTPYPSGFLGVKFFGYNGPFPGTFDSWTNYSSFGNFTWQTDPQFPNKLTARPSGNYIAGYDGLGTKKDIVYAQARMYDGFGYLDALGRADLPWQFNGASSNIIGSDTDVLKDEVVWVQATAVLLTPITYAWTINGVAQPGNSSFVYTSFSTTGYKQFVATMTGSNGAQVQRSWGVQVTCPPPDIFYCP